MNKINKKIDFTEILAIIIVVLITVFVIIYKPSLWKFIPLYISIVVCFLQANINRFAFLLGALNSILYAVAYVLMTLYGTAAYAFAVSFPLQLFAFINWSKNSTGNKTALRYMSKKTRAVIYSSTVIAWLACYLIFKLFNSNYVFFDICITILGILITILSALRYKEYTWFQIICQIITLITHIKMLKEDPSQIIWLISTVYTTICVITAFIKLNGKDIIKYVRKKNS